MTVLVAGSEAELQKLVGQTFEWRQKIGVKLNVKKTKLMPATKGNGVQGPQAYVFVSREIQMLGCVEMGWRARNLD